MATTLIQRADIQAAIAAPVLALMGYKPQATLDTTILYGIGQLTADGREKSRHLFPQLTEAHQTAIQLLAEQGITTPDPFRPLCLLPGNTLTKTELNVKYWVVRMKDLGFGAQEAGKFYFMYASLPSMKQGGYAMCIKYASVKSSSIGSRTADMTLYYGHDASVGINNFAYSTAAEFKASLTDDDYLIYELATPLTIPFSEPLNLTFTDFDPEDGIVLYDRDQQPLWQTHRITLYTDPTADQQTCDLYALTTDYPSESDRLKSCVHYVETLPQGVTQRNTLRFGLPNPDWVAAHKTLPVGIRAQLQGLGLSFNADYLARLEARVAALEAK